jgi:hypothetical protein
VSSEKARRKDGSNRVNRFSLREFCVVISVDGGRAIESIEASPMEQDPTRGAALPVIA